VNFKRILPLVFAVTSFSQISFGQSQIEVKSIDEWNRVKGDTTFVIMDSVGEASNDVYKKIFTDYWKISKIQFIGTDEFQHYLSPGSAYLSLVYPITDTKLDLSSSKYDPDLPDAANQLAMSAEESLNLMTLKLWTCSDKYFKKSDKFLLSYVKEIAAIKMYADVAGVSMAVKQNKNNVSKDAAKTYMHTIQDPGGSISGPYSEGAGAYIFNWGPGIVKNYVQLLNHLLTNGTTGGLIINNDSAKAAKNDTLFVPDYLKYDPASTSKYKERKIDDYFKGYEGNYTVLSNDDLNDKIMHAKKNMYYLQYIRNTVPTVYVVNGFTGQIVYMKKLTPDAELAADDITKVYKAISKK